MPAANRRLTQLLVLFEIATINARRKFYLNRK